ncbi:MAG: PIN domain-containing protein [Peptococcaceae bacterium]|nr:PIN domain-containing protein [Peptococcaceae bacterium]
MGCITEELNRATRVAFDTNSFIYLLERNFLYFKVIVDVFNLIESGKIKEITSALALTEILTKPYKLGDYKLVNEYKILFKHFPNLSVMNVDDQVSEKAAWLRAKYNFRTPDAIFLATALVGGAEVFISNDEQLKRIKELKVIFINDYVQRP